MAKVWEILGDRLAIRRKPPKDVTDGGIALAADAQEVENKGTIVGVGSTCHLREWPIGAEVIFESFNGMEVKLDGGEPVILLPEESISAILVDEPCPSPS